VNKCLHKEVNKRLKYKYLLEHPFVVHYKSEKVDVQLWLKTILPQN
jgi:hypothetical protein